MNGRWRVSNDRGQAVIEFAIGLPLVLLAAFYAFALLDTVTTQEAVDAAARRAALAIAGSNDDAQARGAALATGWIRGQSVAITIEPDGTQVRCPGTAVTITVDAPGHLGFLLPTTVRWRAAQPATIENVGAQSGSCP
jgi:Flp pilus assembly protein TadG